MKIDEILLAIGQGNETAFRKLFYLYKDNIYHTALRLSKDEFIADEVLQETFILVWNNKEKLQDVHDIEAYLYRIAKNSFLARLRQKTLPTESLDLYLHDLKTSHLSIESTEYKELERYFEFAISKLPEKQRLTYLFIKNEGLSRKEVAQILQVSPETVKSNYEEANNKVRNYLLKHLDNIGLATILLFLIKK